MDERTYSKRELKRIIDRALRLQAASDQEPHRSETHDPAGHSLADLVAVGRELGVDEELIRRAAREVEEHGPTGAASRLAGGAIVQSERSLLPYSITREQAEELTVDLERITDLPGQASVAGRRVSWQSNYLAAQQRGWSISVSVAPRGSETVVQVDGNNGLLAGGLFGGLVGGVGIGAGVGIGVGVGVGSLGSALFAVAVPIGFIGLSYAFARALYRAIARNRGRRIAAIAQEITSILDASRPADEGDR